MDVMKDVLTPIASVVIGPVLAAIVAAVSTVFIQGQFTIEMEKWKHRIKRADSLFISFEMFMDALHIHHRAVVKHHSSDYSQAALDKLNDIRKDFFLRLREIAILDNINPAPLLRHADSYSDLVAELFAEGRFSGDSQEARTQREIHELLKSDEYVKHSDAMHDYIEDYIIRTNESSPRLSDTLHRCVDSLLGK